MSHFIVKIASGEFIYGKISIKHSDKKMITLADPLVWEEYMSADGTTGTAMVKYCTGTHEKEIPISTSHVVSMSIMSPNFAKFYDAAVALQNVTDELYEDKLVGMTQRMNLMLLDIHAKKIADASGDIIAYTLADTDSESDTTIH